MAKDTLVKKALQKLLKEEQALSSSRKKAITKKAKEGAKDTKAAARKARRVAAAKKVGKGALMREGLSDVKVSIPKNFRKTVLGDAEIQGTGAPQYERLKKTLGRDKAHKLLSNLKKEFESEVNRVAGLAYKSPESRKAAFQRVYKQYGMQDELPTKYKKAGGAITKKRKGGSIKKKPQAGHNRLY